MKVSISRNRVIEIVSNAEKLKTLIGVKLTYAIAKNLKGLTEEMEVVKGANKPTAGIEAYNAELKTILEAEAKRDDNGNFIPAGSGQIVIANPASFQAKAKELDERFKADLANAKAKSDEFERFLKEPYEFEFFQFEESAIPDTISVEQMGLIIEMVKEPLE